MITQKLTTTHSKGAHGDTISRKRTPHVDVGRPGGEGSYVSEAGEEGQKCSVGGDQADDSFAWEVNIYFHNIDRRYTNILQ